MCHSTALLVLETLEQLKCKHESSNAECWRRVIQYPASSVFGNLMAKLSVFTVLSRHISNWSIFRYFSISLTRFGFFSQYPFKFFYKLWYITFICAVILEYCVLLLFHVRKSVTKIREITKKSTVGGWNNATIAKIS